MPRRRLYVVLSSTLALGLMWGCSASRHRADCAGEACARLEVPPQPAPAPADVPHMPPIDMHDTPREVRNQYDGWPLDADGTPPVRNPFAGSAPGETTLPSNPFETPLTTDAPPTDGDPGRWWNQDPRRIERERLAGQPVEAPRPLVDVSLPDESLQKLGGTVERDAAGHVVLIDLSGTLASDRDLAQLRGMRSLRQLDVSSTAVSDGGLQYLTGLDQLQLLALSGTAVSDAGLEQLQGLKLRFLLLGFTSVSDASIETLAGMKQLEGLSLRGTRLTADGIARLKQALPNCRIVADAPQTSPASRPVPGASRTEDTPAVPEPPARGASEGTPEGSGPSLRQTTLDRGLSAGIPAGTLLQPDSGDLSEAEQQLARIAIGNLADPATYDAIGQYLALTGRRWQSIVWLRAAVKAAPHDRLFAYHLGVALARDGRPLAALPHLTHAVGAAAAQYNLGVIAYQNGDLAASRRHFGRALEQKPELAAARVWIDQIQREATTRTALRGAATR
jgi:tetratricopeptide (TPR) repeat protein